MYREDYPDRIVHASKGPCMETISIYREWSLYRVCYASIIYKALVYSAVYTPRGSKHCVCSGGYML